MRRELAQAAAGIWAVTPARVIVCGPDDSAVREADLRVLVEPTSDVDLRLPPPAERAETIFEHVAAARKHFEEMVATGMDHNAERLLESARGHGVSEAALARARRVAAAVAALSLAGEPTRSMVRRVDLAEALSYQDMTASADVERTLGVGDRVVTVFEGREVAGVIAPRTYFGEAPAEPELRIHFANLELPIDATTRRVDAAAIEEPPALPESVVDEAQKAIAAAGLEVEETTTRGGNPIWIVTGETKSQRAMLREIGGDWYGYRKAWAFTADPTEALAVRLGQRPVETTVEAVADAATRERPVLRVGEEFEHLGRTYRLTEIESYEGGSVRADDITGRIPVGRVWSNAEEFSGDTGYAVATGDEREDEQGKGKGSEGTEPAPSDSPAALSQGSEEQHVSPLLAPAEMPVGAPEAVATDGGNEKGIVQQGWVGHGHLILQAGVIAEFDEAIAGLARRTVPENAFERAVGQPIETAMQDGGAVDWQFALRADDREDNRHPAMVIGQLPETIAGQELPVAKRWIALSPVIFDMMRRNGLVLRGHDAKSPLAVLKDGQPVGVVMPIHLNEAKVVRRFRQLAAEAANLGWVPALVTEAGPEKDERADAAQADSPAPAEQSGKIVEMSKVEKVGDLWTVQILSPVPGVGWIIQGEHRSEAEAIEDRKNWLPSAGAAVGKIQEENQGEKDVGKGSPSPTPPAQVSSADSQGEEVKVRPAAPDQDYLEEKSAKGAAGDQRKSAKEGSQEASRPVGVAKSTQSVGRQEGQERLANAAPLAAGGYLFRIPPASIEFDFNEGGHEPLTLEAEDHPEGLYRAANAVLARWAESAPTAGGYNKTDFKIVFADGEEYEGRLDLKGPGLADRDVDLSDHVRQFNEAQGGQFVPPWMDEARLKEMLRAYGEDAVVQSAAFRDQYALHDDEVGKPQGADGAVRCGAWSLMDQVHAAPATLTRDEAVEVLAWAIKRDGRANQSATLPLPGMPYARKVNLKRPGELLYGWDESNGARPFTATEVDHLADHYGTPKPSLAAAEVGKEERGHERDEGTEPAPPSPFPRISDISGSPTEPAAGPSAGTMLNRPGSPAANRRSPPTASSPTNSPAFAFDVPADIANAPQIDMARLAEPARTEEVSNEQAGGHSVPPLPPASVSQKEGIQPAEPANDFSLEEQEPKATAGADGPGREGSGEASLPGGSGLSPGLSFNISDDSRAADRRYLAALDLMRSIGDVGEGFRAALREGGFSDEERDAVISRMVADRAITLPAEGGQARARPVREDGRLVPIVGDKVSMTAQGPFGLPGAILGTVYQNRKGDLRVRVEGANSLLGGDVKDSQVALTVAWTVRGDPARLRAAVAREDAEAARLEADAAEDAEIIAETVASRDDALARGEAIPRFEELMVGTIVSKHLSGEEHPLVVEAIEQGRVLTTDLLQPAAGGGFVDLDDIFEDSEHRPESGYEALWTIDRALNAAIAGSVEGLADRSPAEMTDEEFAVAVVLGRHASRADPAEVMAGGQPAHMERLGAWWDELRDVADREGWFFDDRSLRECAAEWSPGSVGVTDRLQDLGLFIAEDRTDRGQAVWNVTGETKPHKEMLKELGGRWFGPKTAWSFRKDPTEAIAARLGVSIDGPSAAAVTERTAGSERPGHTSDGRKAGPGRPAWEEAVEVVAARLDRLDTQVADDVRRLLGRVNGLESRLDDLTGQKGGLDNVNWTETCVTDNVERVQKKTIDSYSVGLDGEAGVGFGFSQSTEVIDGNAVSIFKGRLPGEGRGFSASGVIADGRNCVMASTAEKIYLPGLDQDIAKRRRADIESGKAEAWTGSQWDRDAKKWYVGADHPNAPSLRDRFAGAVEAGKAMTADGRTETSGRDYLYVTFSGKEEAKAVAKSAGAEIKFDRDARLWYLPEQASDQARTAMGRYRSAEAKLAVERENTEHQSRRQGVWEAAVGAEEAAKLAPQVEGKPTVEAVSASPQQPRAGPMVALPGLDVRQFSEDQKKSVKEEFGLKWNKDAKGWEMPSDHPKAAQALAQYGQPAANAAAAPAVAAAVQSDKFVILANDKKANHYGVFDSSNKDGKGRPAIAGFLNPEANGNGHKLQAYDGKAVGQGPLAAHHGKVIDPAKPLMAQLDAQPAVARAAPSQQAPAAEAAVTGKPQLWKDTYKEETRAKINEEIDKRTPAQLMADIQSSKEAAKTATDEESRKAYAAGAAKLEAEAVKRGLMQAPANGKAKSQDRGREM